MLSRTNENQILMRGHGGFITMSRKDRGTPWRLQDT
jgi:hypothetical protein